MNGEMNHKAAGMETTETQAGGRRSGIRIMGQLIGLVKPLLPVMLLAIALGTVGHLCAIFLTILAGYGLMHILLDPVMEMLGAEPCGFGRRDVPSGWSRRLYLCALVVMAVMRGILHYGEQYCNHFIAFKCWRSSGIRYSPHSGALPGETGGAG